MSQKDGTLIERKTGFKNTPCDLDTFQRFARSREELDTVARSGRRR
jgi:hypothetical protein